MLHYNSTGPVYTLLLKHEQGSDTLCDYSGIKQRTLQAIAA